MSRFITVQGHPERPEDRRYTRVSLVAPKSFETLGTPLLAGRDFTFEDRGRPRVAIVSQSMAQFYFGNASPIGQHLTIDPETDPYEIVGVVGDVNYYEIREAAARAIYVNAFQWAQPMSEFAIRTSVEPEAVAAAVRGAVHDLLKTVPVVRIDRKSVV